MLPRPGDDPLVEQKRLDRRASALERAASVLGRKGLAQRLGTHLQEGAVRLHLVRPYQIERTEASGIVECEAALLVRLE
jgi:hypothetical protein